MESEELLKELDTIESDNGLLIGSYNGITDAELDKFKEAAKSDVDVYLIKYELEDEKGNKVEVSNQYGVENKIINGQTSFKDADGNVITIKNVEYYTIDDEGKVVKASGSIRSTISKHDVYLDTSSDSILNRRTGEVISSNQDFVNSSMEDLVGRLNLSKKLNYLSKKGEAGIIGSLYDLSDYFSGINGELFDKLFSEAGAITTIADAYSGMDRYGALMALGLSDGGGYNPSGGSYGGGSYSGGSYSGGGSPSPSQTPALTATKLNSDEVRATTKSAIDSIKSSVSSGKYDALTDALGKNLEPGKVGEIDLSNLDNALDKVIPSLEQDADSARAALSDLDAFVSQIGSASTLSGTSWDNVKEDLKTYQSLLGLSIESSEFLSSVIKTAKQMIEDFLYPDTSLDDSILPQLETTLANVVHNIEVLSQQIANMRASQHEVCDENNKNCHLEPSEEEIASLEITLQGFENQRDELQAEIDRIHEYARIVNNAQKMINDAVDQVKNAFDNPVKDAESNEKFVSDFKLNLSAYGIEPDSKLNEYLDSYLTAKENRKEGFTPIDFTIPEPKKKDLRDISEILSSITGDTKVGKYTVDEIRNMSDQEIKDLSTEEFIDLVGSVAQLVYKERGGVLPSITIAQALYEAADGDVFPDGSANPYGLIGYPSDHSQGAGGLRIFDDIIESTYYHATYFEHYENKCYGRFMEECRNGNALGAANYLAAYDVGHESYPVAVRDKINRYDLTRYDNV